MTKIRNLTVELAFAMVSGKDKVQVNNILIDGQNLKNSSSGTGKPSTRLNAMSESTNYKKGIGKGSSSKRKTREQRDKDSEMYRKPGAKVKKGNKRVKFSLNKLV